MAGQGRGGESNSSVRDKMKAGKEGTVGDQDNSSLTLMHSAVTAMLLLKTLIMTADKAEKYTARTTKKPCSINDFSAHSRPWFLSAANACIV